MKSRGSRSEDQFRYYLQLAGAEARERLLLAAAQQWNVPVAELTAKDSVITHTPNGRTTGRTMTLVSDNRVDIWVGDPSPQETRFSCSKITGIPEQNVYVSLCHLSGGVLSLLKIS